MCKLGMFSHQAGLLQTAAVKRSEIHFNGAEASSSGETTTPYVETTALPRCSGQALGCPAKAQPSGPLRS